MNDQKSGWGLLADPEHWRGLTGNPMFNMGMGLLSSSYDENVNPFAAMMGGLQQAGEENRTQEQRKRDAEMREMLENYFKSQQNPTRQQATAVDSMISPQVQRGLAANALDPQNADLYRRMAWREILGRM